MKITGLKTFNEQNRRIYANPHGNNVAFNCFCCGRAVLAIALDNQRGSDKKHWAKCGGCRARYFLDVKQKPASGKNRWPPTDSKEAKAIKKKGKLYICLLPS